MRISDWSSDVCSSDLTTQAQSLECKEFAQRRDLDRIRILVDAIQRRQLGLLDELRSLDIGRDHAFFNQAMRTIPLHRHDAVDLALAREIGRASGRERVWQYV